MITQLLLGHETQLKGGARGPISARILNMFTESKRLNSNEQHMDEEQNLQPVTTVYFAGFLYLICWLFDRFSHYRIQSKNNLPCGWVVRQCQRVLVVLNFCGNFSYCALLWENYLIFFFFSAIFGQAEMRLCGAFSQDTTFF